MSEAMKEIFDRERMAHIAREMVAVEPGFDSERFFSLATKGLDELSIMQRLARVSDSLHATLGLDFEPALECLYALAPRLNSGFVSMALPHYVACHGLQRFESSMSALRYFTTFGSSEFAIRHFLLRDFERTLTVMKTWAEDDNHHVRRLASEGCRPRLPWSFRLPTLMADPRPVLPILERLKADDSLYVRKSVANHLNDIAKDNPHCVLERIEGWSLDDARTKWIARHGLRTLIKQGDLRALALMGASAKAQVELSGLVVMPAEIRLGESMTFSFTLTSTATECQRLIVDYAIDYRKQAGHAASKVFKFKTLELDAGASVTLSKRQHIRDMSTRRHHPGHHGLHVMVNGERMGTAGFELVV
ncbi:DNA alkylation repair protein [Pseudomonas sp. LRF_L74]|uniref:DNA alkylation repair protein n=1 Tax=Pseudomonas sp. LRF_L74 TaxID=3369422 RepID=UPI003F6092B3